MPTYDFSKYTLYRWRYTIGYTLIGFLLSSVLLFSGYYLPGGLSNDEMDSVVTSQSFNFSDPATLAVANAPYHKLQALSMQLLGGSTLSIKLVSLVLALATAVGLIILLRRWFRPSIAVLGSLIALSNSQFIYIAQLGTPFIMYLFWPVVLLVLGTQITRSTSKRRFIWKLLFAFAAGLSLYTPLSIYPLVVIASAIVLHPHLRTIIRRLSAVRLVIVSLLFAIVAAPLVYLTVVKPGLALELIGVPSSFPIDALANIRSVIEQYFYFWNTDGGELMTPMFSLAAVLLMMIGLVRLIRTRETTRSYLVMIWFVWMVPILITNPSLTIIGYVPAVLLLTAGLQSLIFYWYRLFPYNPYARLLGFLPIALLVIAAIFLGVSRFAYGYHYSPKVAASFSNDLLLLPDSTTQLCVREDEHPFWHAIGAYKKNLSITCTATDGTFVVTTKAHGSAVSGYSLSRIITNTHTDDSARFYVYHKDTK